MDEDQNQIITDQNNPADPPGGNGQDNSLDEVDPDDLKHQQAKPPSVLGEEDVSGTAPEEPMNIDEELQKFGLHGDDKGIKPLGVKSELDQEVE